MNWDLPYKYLLWRRKTHFQLPKKIMDIPIEHSNANMHLCYVAGMVCKHSVQLFSECDKTRPVQSPPERIKLLYDPEVSQRGNSSASTSHNTLPEPRIPLSMNILNTLPYNYSSSSYNFVSGF